MDFIYQPSSDRLVVIECNPRIHTAVGLLTGSTQADRLLADALDGGKEFSLPLMPPVGVGPMSWWGHDLISRHIPARLPFFQWISPAIHPLWKKHSTAGHPDFDLEEVGTKDAAWDVRDPFYFLALYHIQMPFLLLRQLFIRRRAYSRINISTARIFEC